jgi:hypothetical protein
MEFDENTLTIGRVDPSRGARSGMKLTEIRRFKAISFNDGGELEPLTGRRFRVGASRRMALAALPARPGLYFLEFRASYAAVAFLQEHEHDRPFGAMRGAFEQKFHFVADAGVAGSQPASENPS